MPEGARLAIVERLLPERAADDPAAIMIDLHMMTITGGRARSLADFATLLSEAGLTLSKVTPTSSGPRHHRSQKMTPTAFQTEGESGFT